MFEMSFVKELADVFDRIDIPLTLADITAKDHPLVLCNSKFETMTGYRSDEVIGRNCRFLQGARANDEARAEVSRAVANGEPVQAMFANVTKGGDPFDNLLFLFPIEVSGRLTHYLGSQVKVEEVPQAAQAMERSDWLIDMVQATTASNARVLAEHRREISNAAAATVRSFVQIKTMRQF